MNYRTFMRIVTNAGMLLLWLGESAQQKATLEILFHLFIVAAYFYLSTSGIITGEKDTSV